MSYKFKSEDFYHALRSVQALGAYPHDLSDFGIRNSSKYKEACEHLHKDMLEESLVVVDMDSIPGQNKLAPFQLTEKEVLIALQTAKPGPKRMISVVRFAGDYGKDPDEMIIVPLVSMTKERWQPVGIVIFLKDLEDPEKMRIRTQEFPGAIVAETRMQEISGIILDAVNMIATALATKKVIMTVKTPSKLKLDRAEAKHLPTDLRSFTLLQGTQ